MKEFIMGAIFNLLAFVISVYNFCCLIRVLLTWFPNMNYSKPGRILGQICDPYLNWFRRFRFLQFGRMDFSPVAAMGVLILCSGIFRQIAAYGSIGIGVILAGIVNIVWSIIGSIISIFNIIVAIRLVINLLNKDFSSGMWGQLDTIVYPVRAKIMSFFKNRSFSFRAELGITLAAGILAQLIGSWLFGFLASLLASLPF